MAVAVHQQSNPATFYTMYSPFGDTALAGIFGTSAALIGSEPWAAMVDSTRRGPEAFPEANLRMAAEAYSPGTDICTKLPDAIRALVPGCVTAGGGGIGDSPPDDWCNRIPAPLRWAIAPCAGKAIGGAIGGTELGQSLAKTAIVWLVAAAIIVVGVISLTK